VTTFFATLLLFGLAFGGLALGTMLGRQPIKGSCGGLNGGACELCSGTGECRRKAKNQR